MGVNYNIDFVITWVNGNDEAWQKEKRAFNKDSDIDDQSIRYRDWDLLRYWFRGIEKFAPWVRKIHFVTWGHVPSWLDTSNPKLHIVNHKDFMPKDSLPCFNSNALELNLHRIPGLSEHFVYFNDDIFPLLPLNPDDFFVGGLPCDMLALQPIIANPDNPVMSHIFLNNSLIVSKYFNKRKNILKQPSKYFKIGYPPLYFFYNILELSFPQFTGLYTVHGAAPLCRKTYCDLWNLEFETFSDTTNHHIRSKDDISIYLIRDWQKLSGKFHPKNIQKDLKYYKLSDKSKKIMHTIIKQQSKLICLNDSDADLNFNKVQKQLKCAFEKILPSKCSYEI